MTRIATLLASCLLVCGCDDDVVPDGGVADLAARFDGDVPRDLAMGPADAAVDAAQPADLTPIADLAQSDGCVPNMGPGCCYPRCALGEELVCMGKNICGYPCACEAMPNGAIPEVSADRPEIFQNCQPIVMPDPTRVTLSLGVNNPRPADIGPIHVGGGRVIDAQGKTLLSFTWQPVADFVVPGQNSVRLALDKTAGSGKPANGCNTLPCNATARVVVDYGPPGVPATRSVTSSETTIFCVF